MLYVISMASRGLMRNINKITEKLKKNRKMSTYNLMDETDLSQSWFEKNRGYILHKFSFISYTPGQKGNPGIWEYHGEDVA